MKLDKATLKSIVKECLVEILSEGLTQSSQALTSKNKRIAEGANRTRAGSSRTRSLRSLGESSSSSQTKSSKTLGYLDNIKFGASEERKEKHEAAIKSTTTKLTKDPLMQDILADTARTTLQEQISADSRTNSATSEKLADSAARIVSQNSPEELFGESASKWAHLAFM